MGNLDDKIKQLNDLRAERIPRPPTKKEYAALIHRLESEIAGIVAASNKENDRKRESAKRDLKKRNESVVPIGQRLAALELAVLEIREAMK